MIEQFESIKKTTDTKIAGLNANRVMLCGKHYIAAGDPACTADKFWEMILSEKSPVIVKLNAGRSSYWPLSKRCTVEVIEESNLGSSLTERVMRVTHGKESREVIHLDFSGWPDFGVPECSEFTALIKRVNEVYNGSGPLTVHCQGGKGRTGTFLAIHALQEAFLPDFKEVVLQMRWQRDPHMVENQKQFNFIQQQHYALEQLRKIENNHSHSHADFSDYY